MARWPFRLLEPSQLFLEIAKKGTAGAGANRGLTVKRTIKEAEVVETHPFFWAPFVVVGSRD